MLRNNDGLTGRFSKMKSSSYVSRLYSHVPCKVIMTVFSLTKSLNDVYLIPYTLSSPFCPCLPLWCLPLPSPSHAGERKASVRMDHTMDPPQAHVLLRARQRGRAKGGRVLSGVRPSWTELSSDEAQTSASPSCCSIVDMAKDPP